MKEGGISLLPRLIFCGKGCALKLLDVSFFLKTKFYSFFSSRIVSSTWTAIKPDAPAIEIRPLRHYVSRRHLGVLWD